MTGTDDRTRRPAEIPAAARTGAGRQPGDPDPKEQVARMIRVDHAGEYGAARIYAGQIAVLGASECGETLRHMRDQEAVHLAAFETLIAERRVRPTALGPLWHLAGFALGAGTALLGKEAAMACTEAVEEVIDEHYRKQAESLGDDEKELRETIDGFRAEEIEHRDIARAEGAAEAPGYAPLTTAIKAGSRLAIWLSTRI
ncbi:demethoxyubiquinone hydroxylase family protein [Oceanibacterium hippocampi]|uniref:3-demethoxyubiquinol 3-hydroxylase n=1 Tax=Oceanibacterium hippocampi TaxID=745714 RepID=A0A1Y5S0E1_9PROT|nr:demethoxyubiquinone hydroxylase family protein [Oceanibacterium hippocampi]SLN26774.1 2-nonaprenyl-3-methyl-6-methoxy-1,4-benzoquinol hydroxylase [Oceanibacterium hippocampi]